MGGQGGVLSVAAFKRDGPVIFYLLAGEMLHLANLGGGRGLLVYSILIFSGRMHNMTEILLTGTLSLT